MLKLLDNTEYKGTDMVGNFPKVDKKQSAFLSSISDKTIEELNKEGGDILVWPHSFKDSTSNIAKMKILEFSDKDKFMQTNNLVGFIGNGEVEIEINSRFSVKRNITTTQKKLGKKGTEKMVEKEVTIDYFLYYMLSKVFSANIVNLEVGGGSLKELDFLLFVFPKVAVLRKNTLYQVKHIIAALQNRNSI